MLVSSLRNPVVADHLVRQRLQLRLQLSLFASLCPTPTSVSPVFVVSLTPSVLVCTFRLEGAEIDPGEWKKLERRLRSASRSVSSPMSPGWEATPSTDRLNRAEGSGSSSESVSLQVLDVLVVAHQPQLHFIDRFVNVQVVRQRRVSHDPESQVVDVDRFADVPVVLRRQMPTIQTVQKAMATVPSNVFDV